MVVNNRFFFFGMKVRNLVRKMLLNQFKKFVFDHLRWFKASMKWNEFSRKICEKNSIFKAIRFLLLIINYNLNWAKHTAHEHWIACINNKEKIQSNSLRFICLSISSIHHKNIHMMCMCVCCNVEQMIKISYRIK